MTLNKAFNKQNSYILPLAIVCFLFFTVGFALGINGILIPILKSSLQMASGAAYLIIFATFAAFLIFSFPAGWVIKKVGYKKTMALAFLIFAIGFLLFVYSATICVVAPKSGFIMFLVASFVCGVGNTVEQAAINPYLTILGPINSAARRISIAGICNKLSYPVAILFVAFLLGKATDTATISDIIMPFYIIAAIFFLLGILVLFAPLKEIKAVGEEREEDCPYAAGKKSIWQFPHLILGAIALFLYVGVETLALQTTVDFATTVGLSNATWYSWLPSLGMIIGYLVGVILIPKPLSQGGALKICAWLAIVGTLLTVLVPASWAIWFVPSFALACSLIWPAIWPLAMADMGKFTKQAGSLMTATIFGGAVVPLLFGFLQDILVNQGLTKAVAFQQAYWLALPCYVYILWYAYKGYKIRR